MSDIARFGERLSELMFDRKLTPYALAGALELNVYDIYHWQKGNGKFMPSLSVLIKLADYFECSIEFLIGLEDENYLPRPNKDLPPFSLRFPLLVKEKGYTLTRLRALTKISNTTVFYSWIHAKTEPRIDSLIAVSRALDCSVDYLLGRETD